MTRSDVIGLGADSIASSGSKIVCGLLAGEGERGRLWYEGSGMMGDH